MRRLAIAVFMMVFIAGWAVAQDDTNKTADQILDAMSSQVLGDEGVVQLKMIVYNKQGRSRSKELLTVIQKKDGIDRAITVFLAPPEIRGNKFLAIENPDGYDKQMMYLKGNKKLKRFDADSAGDSFMGSDFSMKDIQSRDSSDGIHKRLPDETVDGQPCYVVQTVPKPGKEDDMGYSKIVYWVRKDSMIPVKADFYKLGDPNTVEKKLSVDELEQRDDGTWTAKKTTMQTIERGTKTEIVVLDSRTDVTVDDYYFTEPYMTNENQLIPEFKKK
ncbi:MAG: outer membrane lipoprotein-sorting protein [Candidatus Alcyoniella australis]|nr:outer membrane lipoprotein-sorting protein [Candidatus Alcyoniella australis]